MTDFPVTLFHNPACGTSRNVLAALEAQDYAPTIVLYQETGWTETQLRDLAQRAGLTLRQLLRDKEVTAIAPELLAEGTGEDALIEAMVAHPLLVQRPIVETPMGVVLARPSERVFEVLDRRPASFVKEDGEVVVL